MNEQRNNGRGIFYGVIGVATLVVAIIGATFAYFTATQNVNNIITGNMATVTFGLSVTKVTKADEDKGGMIPMSNTMVEAALKNKSDTSRTDAEKNAQICVDDNGNAVCQIYKIAVTNGGTAGMLLDGYVSLTGGSDSQVLPADTESGDWPNLTGESTAKTTMRWAQVFCTGTDNALSSCTTEGVTTTRATGTGAGFGTTKWAKVEAASDTSGKNKAQIVTKSGISDATIGIETPVSIVANGTIAGNTYKIINTNYIRISDHTVGNYSRTADMTSALVLNQQIDPMAGTQRTIAANDDSNGIGGSTPYTDAQVYYIVVWLSESGRNQTAGADGVTTGGKDGTSGIDFFQGNVSFISAQGSEVTATFSGYSRVPSNT